MEDYPCGLNIPSPPTATPRKVTNVAVRWVEHLNPHTEHYRISRPVLAPNWHGRVITWHQYCVNVTSLITRVMFQTLSHIIVRADLGGEDRARQSLELFTWCWITRCSTIGGFLTAPHGRLWLNLMLLTVQLQTDIIHHHHHHRSSGPWLIPGYMGFTRQHMQQWYFQACACSCTNLGNQHVHFQTCPPSMLSSNMLSDSG